MKLGQILLREWRAGDEASLVLYANNRNVWINLRDRGRDRLLARGAVLGQGIATEALRAVTEYALKNFDLCRIDAGIFEWNLASMRVLGKAGL